MELQVTSTPRFAAGSRLATAMAVSLIIVACASAPPEPPPEPEPAASQSITGNRPVAQPSQPPPPPRREVELQPTAPQTYIVQEGDTLWDISTMFLKDAWFWPEIWYVNPEIENPHLIYPGDILRLVWVDGRPSIQVERGQAERLSPRIRAESLESAILTIPYEAIAAFLTKPSVIAKDEVDGLPYILTTRDGRLVIGANEPVYVRGTDRGVGARYNVIRIGDPLRDPDDGDVIGYEGVYVGEGRIDRGGDPATMFLLSTAREALEGDRMVPQQASIPLNFIPRPPESAIDGRIISVVDGVALIGQYQVVAINRGARHGLEPGHVLAIYQTGQEIRDRYASGGLIKESFGEKVRLPDEPAGTLMVFQTHDRMSYGLVMEAILEMRVLDTVRNP